MLLGFTTSEMLHRCICAFLVQSVFYLKRQYHCGRVLPCLMPRQVVFSKLVDIIIASLLFRSLFYDLLHVLLEPGMHISIVNKLAHSLLNFDCNLLKTRVSLRYFVSHCLWKLFFDSNLPQTPSNLRSLNFLITVSPFTLF